MAQLSGGTGAPAFPSSAAATAALYAAGSGSADTARAAGRKSRAASAAASGGYSRAGPAECGLCESAPAYVVHQWEAAGGGASHADQWEISANQIYEQQTGRDRLLFLVKHTISFYVTEDVIKYVGYLNF